MPSPISHTLLTRFLPIETTAPYLNKQRYNKRYFQFGSIGPDIPYGSALDFDLDLFENESDLSNLFHFTMSDQDISLSPNLLPLAGLRLIKNKIEEDKPNRESDAFFGLSWVMPHM